MPVEIVRELQFDAGHRLPRHESKCRHVHGHRYRVEVRCVRTDTELDDQGRVIDFGAVKELVGPWVDARLDHAFLVADEDEVMLTFLREQSQRYFRMAAPPTAENIAELIGVNAQALFRAAALPIRVTGCVVYETPNCRAEWRPA